MTEKPAITSEDFRRANIDGLLRAASERECFAYSTILLEALKEGEAEAAPDESKRRLARVYRVLHDMCFLTLSPEDPINPLAPAVVFANSRTAIMESVTAEELSAVSDFLPDISDPELRSRVGDVIWVTRRSFQAAEIAVRAYLNAASTLEDPKEWVPCGHRLERAIRLAASLNRPPALFPEVLRHIKGVIERNRDRDDLFLCARMMALLLEFDPDVDAALYRNICKGLAERAESASLWHVAREHWKIRAAWDRRLEVDQRESLLALAEAYVKEADVYLRPGRESYTHASVHLASALQAFRRVPSTEDRRLEVHSRLVDCQAKAVRELRPISGKTDLSDLVRQIQDGARGKTFFDALLYLASSGKSPTVNDLRRRVEEHRKRYPLQTLIASTMINESGQVVARVPDLISGGEEEREAGIRARMHQETQFHRQLHVQALILPIREIIDLEHAVQPSDLLRLLENNPFVPEGREGIFARGLFAGLKGDFLVAVHLLVPQIENSIRHLLQENGVVTSGMSAEGIQEERNLTALLEMEELRRILDEDTIFDLQGLLVERFGSNLRNRAAHGLLQHEAFYSVDAVYAWWITFRLCCLPVIATLRAEAAARAQEPEGDGEEGGARG